MALLSLAGIFAFELFWLLGLGIAGDPEASRVMGVLYPKKIRERGEQECNAEKSPQLHSLRNAGFRLVLHVDHLPALMGLAAR